MNKIKSLLLLILLFFTATSTINADDTVCTYGDKLTITYNSSGSASFNQEYFASDNIAEWAKELLKALGVDISETDIDATQQIVQQPWNHNGKCPSDFYVCTLKELSVNPGIAADILRENLKVKKSIYIFYSKHEMESNSDLAYYKDGTDFRIGELEDSYHAVWDNDYQFLDVLKTIGSMGWDLFQVAGGNSSAVKVVEKNCKSIKYTGNLPTYNPACSSYQGFMDQINNGITEYQGCGSDSKCISNSIKKMNDGESKLKNYCNTILSSYNYDEGTEQDCIISCLSAKDEIEQAKKDAGLYVESDGECGLTSSIILWIANIVKWAKYFIPVLVIILGIIDFMKAVGTDKDDEMKKAQGRFIKRLIAAALIFIIPLIIGFLLEITGFNVTGCGIIDL